MAVGIPIEFNATAEPLGSKRLSHDELIECAKAWLDSRLEKEECDPFGGPQTNIRIYVPLGVLDYCREEHAIQPWL